MREEGDERKEKEKERGEEREKEEKRRGVRERRWEGGRVHTRPLKVWVWN